MMSAWTTSMQIIHTEERELLLHSFISFNARQNGTQARDTADKADPGNDTDHYWCLLCVHSPQTHRLILHTANTKQNERKGVSTFRKGVTQ